MNKILFAGFGAIAFMSIMGFSAHVMLRDLELETQRQCANHDWPKEADLVNREWCVDNGYKI